MANKLPLVGVLLGLLFLQKYNTTAEQPLANNNNNQQS